MQFLQVSSKSELPLSELGAYYSPNLDLVTFGFARPRCFLQYPQYLGRRFANVHDVLNQRSLKHMRQRQHCQPNADDPLPLLVYSEEVGQRLFDHGMESTLCQKLWQ